ncbi:MAG TPA: aldo/keto reductase [Stellaceae bacterium]|nr:aldo/keto reductase [Stellaceae bacterium]
MIFVDMQGRKVPSLGYGTWDLRGPDCERAVAMAIELGYRHIDTAQSYENEAEVGRGWVASGLPRRDLFITTKIARVVGGDVTGNSTTHVAKGVEESLRKLRTDYVDLLLIHWPSPDVPLAETLEAMERLKSAGKARALGVSNFTVAHMREAVTLSKSPVACNQVEYHLLLSQKPVLSYAREHGIAVTAYCPIARGKLVGHPVVERVARKHGKTANQIGLRWLLEQPGVLAIPKAGSQPHARENISIFDFSLDAEDRRSLDALPGNTRLVSPGWAPKWDQA